MKTKLSYDYEHYASTAELPEADRTLVAEAERATRRSHAPYSKFRVGAAARLASGKVLHAGNFESEVFPAGLCAERSLLFYVQTNFPDDPIETLAIASDPSPRECYPCGQCRQVMVDVERRQGRPMRIVMSGGGTASAVDAVHDAEKHLAGFRVAAFDVGLDLVFEGALARRIGLYEVGAALVDHQQVVVFVENIVGREHLRA